MSYATFAHRVRAVCAVVACVSTGLAIPGTLRAQRGEVGTGGIKGLVRDSLGQPVAGAQIAVAGTSLVVESDDNGEFLLAKAAPGETSLRIRRIGFRPDTVRVSVLAGETAAADVTLTRLAIELDPLVVVGRRNVSGRIAGFYERMSRGSGGHFLTREAIERRNPVNMTDLFRMIPGAQVQSRGFGRTVVRFRGGRTAPLVWLDGTPLYAAEFDLDSVDPRTFEGVEIYSGPASVPAEFQGNRAISSSGGTIILWTKEGELRTKKRKKDQLSPAAIIERMVEAKTVFTASEVDAPAAPDSSDLIRPVYPDSMFMNAIPGRTMVEFVVDATGDVNMDTFSIVTASHPQFGEAVRRAVKDQRYKPARRNGRAVQQVVQQPFDFVPDSTILRRRR
ncbi:MAG: TonB family protein [Gemmatimonadetes bacterium]|nr:TonB family protein [Gemmatimonadota bacterium]